MSSPEMPSLDASPAPKSLLQYPSFVRLWFTRTATTGAFHMQGVAVGWQLYEMTGNPIDLGIVGFIQFLPLVVLNLVVGQVTDRYDRRVIMRRCQVVKVLMVVLLAVGTAMGWLTREWMFAILLVASTARAFEMPVMQALMPSIVPIAAPAARDRGVGDRAADRDHLRPGDRRAALSPGCRSSSTRPAPSSAP